MKTLAIIQPWPYAILHLGKDIENRSWRTNVRGRILIHASRGFDLDGYAWIREQFAPQWPLEPDYSMFPRGGIVGSAVIRDCVQTSDSPWFFGPYGFVLQGAKPMPLIPARGSLGFFEVPDVVVGEAA